MGLIMFNPFEVSIAIAVIRHHCLRLKRPKLRWRTPQQGRGDPGVTQGWPRGDLGDLGEEQPRCGDMDDLIIDDSYKKTTNQWWLIVVNTINQQQWECDIVSSWWWLEQDLNMGLNTWVIGT